MIIPIVFTLSPYYEDLTAGWMFYKAVSFSSAHGWPVFAQQIYYTDKEGLRRQGHPGEENGAVFDYQYTPADEARYIHEVFPQELVDAFIARHPSQTDAYMSSLIRPWSEMTDWLAQRIRADEARTGENAEGLLCIHATRFVRDAAQALGIPILHYEWGAFRHPFYRKTALLDLTGGVNDCDLAGRFRAFQARKADAPILSRREILALMLTDEHLHYAADVYPTPEYEAGVLCGYSVPFVYSAENGVTNAEMLTRVLRRFGRENVCARFHPGDPARPAGAPVAVPDCNLIDFILNAKRLVGIASNTTFEGMLFGRPTYDLGNTRFRQFANESLDALPDHIASEEFLSFVSFSFYIPWELLKNAEYLRWRLSRPPEEEIYLYHLRWYLNCLGLPESALSLPEGERLEQLLRYRGLDAQAAPREETPPVWLRADETARLTVSVTRLQRQAERMRAEMTRLQAENRELREALNALRSPER